MENTEQDQVGITLRVPGATLALIDAFAKDMGVSRNQLIVIWLRSATEGRHVGAEALAGIQQLGAMKESKSQRRRMEVHQTNTPVENEAASEVEVMEAVEQTYSPEPETRHWHRIDNRRPEDAERIWFDKGQEFGEFKCSCGKLVTRTVKR